MWNIKSSIEYLISLRDQLGPMYGSEDLCIFMYSLIKREKPSIVVELGTGMGVTSAWIAAAMQENGSGMLRTYDNGSHFREGRTKDFLAQLGGPLVDLARVSERGTYEEFLHAVFEYADVAGHVRYRCDDIDLSGDAVREELSGMKVDVLFSDFSHSPKAIMDIIAAYLPHMNETSSIFIDSASTFMPSFLALERLVSLFDRGIVPAWIRNQVNSDQLEIIADKISQSKFQLVHLVEKVHREQNSTAWLRIEPYDMFPPIATYLRG